MRLAIAVACVCVLTGPARAEDTDDYDPYSSQWNGMSSFVGLAEGMGFEVGVVSALEWGDLSANDILVLVYPLQRVDPARLGAFVQAGGNVVIADDFGEGKDAMQALGFLRAELTTVRASKYQNGQLWAPIATTRGDHPLTTDVGEIVTNHPSALTQVQGATVVAGFEDGALVVAGERGNGRFVAISDPSVLINRMLQFGGNVQLATNTLRWLERGGRARRVVLLRGDVPMYGDPRPFIDDSKSGQLGRTIADLNFWLSQRREWLLTPGAMKALAAILAVSLLLLALVALPVRRGPKIDGAWLRFGRPARRDEAHALVSSADRNAGSNLVLACILRDQVQIVLAGVTGKLEPLYTISESHLVAEVTRLRGPYAGAALTRVYRQLRALPSRGQAASPWSAGHLPRRDFDLLYKDVADLCRTLGSELPEDGSPQPPISVIRSRPPQPQA